jgi:hypothetical protein
MSAEGDEVSRLQKAIIARILLLAAFWLSGCSFVSSPINISGMWVGDLQWTDGPAETFIYPFTLDLVHEDRDLSGTATIDGPGSVPFALDIRDGYARTHTMSLEASGVFPGSPPQSVTFELEGDFHETQMSGTGSQTINGTTYHFTWEAVLVVPAVPEE